ncbi:unnamed protein product, partial [Closterium sp. NIES-53]
MLRGHTPSEMHRCPPVPGGVAHCITPRGEVVSAVLSSQRGALSPSPSRAPLSRPSRAALAAPSPTSRPSRRPSWTRPAALRPRRPSLRHRAALRPYHGPYLRPHRPHLRSSPPLPADPTALTCGLATIPCGPVALTYGPAAITCGPVARTCGPAALTCGPAALTCGPAALTCGLAALTCGPRRPQLRLPTLLSSSTLLLAEEFQCLAATSPHLVSVLLTPEGDPDALDIPTPRSYAEAIEGPYSSQWQAAMDAEMASWKSTGTYVDAVPPPGANIVSGMWIFRVKRPPGSPPVFKARYVARGFSQRQGVDYFQTFSPTPKMTTLRVLLHVAAHRDYELHSLDFSTAFLQGSLHEEIWLRRPPGFTGSFPPGTQWSLRRPVYGLRQAP